MRSMIVLFLAISGLLNAQNLGNLLNKGKKLLGDEGKKAVSNLASDNKAKLDSVDFQFAISINENAGFFDISQKGETLTRGLYLLKDPAEKTKSEQMRDALDTALFAYDKRWFKVAEQKFLSIKKEMESSGLTKDITYLKCLSNLGLVHMMKGEYDESKNYFQTSLETSESVLGKNSAAYAANLNNYAKLDQLTGKLNEAEEDFSTARQILVKVFGEKSMQAAIVTNNEAMLQMMVGRSDQAASTMKKAIEILESSKSGGEKSFDNRKFQINLGLIYQLSNKFPEAETTFLSIKKIFENRLETNSPEYAGLLNQLAILYIQMDKPQQVEELLKKSADIYRKRFTEDNAAYAKVQSDLGVFYRMQQKFPEAEAASLKALEIRSKVLGNDHPDYVKSVENVGLVYWKKGDLPKAYPYLKEGLDKSLSFISNYFPPMSEAEKTKYWETLQPRFQRFYNFAIDFSSVNPTVLTNVFNAQIATKALLLNTTNKVKQAILASGNKTLINTYLTWIGKKEALSHYYALTKEELAEQKIDLKALEKEANDLERSLSSQSQEFSKGYSAQVITIEKLSPLLRDDEALVEVVHVRNFDKDFTDQSRYMALTITKGKNVPTLSILENGQQLDSRYVKYYKNAAINKIEDNYSYDQFWSKIDATVTGKKYIYFSPDGAYNQINVNTLNKPGGNYLLARYDIVSIGNPKDLIRLKQPTKPSVKKSAFLIGFPDYGGSAVPLPGTKVELEAVNKILKTSGFVSDLKQEKDASEKNLKSVKGPTIMHIATHGYFLADAESGNANSLGVNAENLKSNPLLHSGLILANPSGKTPDTERTDFSSADNGVLTAFEATNLSLEGTDLVVLSACETGLGTVKAGEGVYGLQRAFLVAGANALIMSLWKVDDAATQQLMTNFYSNYSKSPNKLKAFKLAQQQLMTKYKDPYYWGAFVMIGM